MVADTLSRIVAGDRTLLVGVLFAQMLLLPLYL